MAPSSTEHPPEPDLSNHQIGGYLIGRQLLEGFEPLLRVDLAPPPRLVAAAASVTRAARLGAALPPVLLDAGAEPPAPWFVLRRRD